MTTPSSSIWAITLMFLFGGLPACSGIPGSTTHHEALTPAEHVTLGTSYEEQGFKDMAALEYQAALKQRHEFAPALVSLGNLSFEKGALQEAEEYYHRALVIAPDHPSANNNLAVVYLWKGERIDEAEHLAKRALEQAGPLRPYVLDTIAKIYMLKGEYVEAKDALEEAQAIAPADDAVLLEQLEQSKQELMGDGGSESHGGGEQQL